MSTMKAFTICITLLALYTLAAGAQVVRAEDVGEVTTNDSSDGGQEITAPKEQSAKLSLMSSGRKSKTMTKEKLEEVPTRNEVSLRSEAPEEVPSADARVHVSARTSLPTSARVTCGNFFRCNPYATFNRCFRVSSRVWYARYFRSSGACNGNVYLSGNRICIRAGSYCCARIYYMRA